jgi:hypothetical protein
MGHPRLKMESAVLADGAGKDRIVSLVEFSERTGIPLKALLVSIEAGHWGARNGLTASGQMDLDVFEGRYLERNRRRNGKRKRRA